MGAAAVWLLLFLCAGLVPLPGEAQVFPGRSPRHRLRLWLRSEHLKVKRDCERLVAETRQLREETEKIEPALLPEDIRKRVLVLERQALELRAEAEAVDENFLSVSVVLLAEEMREEGKALQKYFSENLPANPGKKLSALADSIEDRADDIADRMRLP
ncbi:MAG: hypothetical protein ACE5G6_01425 [Terriglobia bacterium]